MSRRRALRRIDPPALLGAGSSAGRAPGSQPGGHRFESCSAHHLSHHHPHAHDARRSPSATDPRARPNGGEAAPLPARVAARPTGGGRRAHPRRGDVAFDIPAFRFGGTGMSDELDRLWALKDLDERASLLRAELKRFPEQRATLERAVAEQSAKLERHRAQTGANQVKRRELEREIESLTAQERKFQSQTFAVKKNEEYRALLDEIEGVKKKRSDLETDVLMTFEAEERLSGERAAAERALQSAQREAAERTRQIDAEERAARER